MSSGISVIIPTYNNAANISQAINSVLGQGVAACEIIVVDDGSTDDTAVQLRPYQDNIRKVHQAHSGLAAACNRGLSLAQHEFILFLPATGALLPGKLQQLAAYLQLRPSLGYVAGGWQHMDGLGQVGQTVEPWQQMPELTLDAWLQYRQVQLGALMFRR
ncbi:MAG: glycosyltransferase family 2 protein, partial [Anaerolineales bacterium]|nr:glycosyltransferase family 2 protein [Anaerolineales bacterium]